MRGVYARTDPQAIVAQVRPGGCSQHKMRPRGCCISFQGLVSSSARGPINHVKLDRPLSFARTATTSGWKLGINATSGHVGPLEQTRHRILVIHATWTRGRVQSIAHLDVQQSISFEIYGVFEFHRAS